MPTPAEIQAMLDQAWDDVQNEFAGCLGEVPDEETRAALRKEFDKTVGNAIKNNGVAWEEPIKSYALRHVCMIARASKKCKDDPSIAKCLPKAAATIIKKARESCDRLEQQEGAAGVAARANRLGIICPRS